MRFENPAGLPAPLGPYSHVAVVPAGSELVFVAGQVGIAADGTAAPTIAGQAELAFANLIAALRSQELDAADIVRLSVFIVSGHDATAVKLARQKFLGDHRPTSTTIFVPQLVSPEWYVEVDAIAVRSRVAS